MIFEPTSDGAQHTVQACIVDDSDSDSDNHYVNTFSKFTILRSDLFASMGHEQCRCYSLFAGSLFFARTMLFSIGLKTASNNE